MSKKFKFDIPKAVTTPVTDALISHVTVDLSQEDQGLMLATLTVTLVDSAGAPQSSEVYPINLLDDVGVSKMKTKVLENFVEGLLEVLSDEGVLTGGTLSA